MTLELSCAISVVNSPKACPALNCLVRAAFLSFVIEMFVDELGVLGKNWEVCGRVELIRFVIVVVNELEGKFDKLNEPNEIEDPDDEEVVVDGLFLKD